MGKFQKTKSSKHGTSPVGKVFFKLPGFINLFPSQELDIKAHRGVGWDLIACAIGAIGHRGVHGEKRALAFHHGGDAFIPAANHKAQANTCEDDRV